MVNDAKANEADDKKRIEQVQARNQLDTLVHSVKKSVEEHGDKVGDEKAKIEAARKRIEDITDGRGDALVKRRPAKHPQTLIPWPQLPGLNFAQGIRTRAFWGLVVSFAAFSFYNMTISTNLMLMLGEKGITAAQAGSLFVVLGIVGLFARLSVGWLLDRFGAQPTLIEWDTDVPELDIENAVYGIVARRRGSISAEHGKIGRAHV